VDGVEARHAGDLWNDTHARQRRRSRQGSDSRCRGLPPMGRSRVDDVWARTEAPAALYGVSALTRPVPASPLVEAAEAAANKPRNQAGEVGRWPAMNAPRLEGKAARRGQCDVRPCSSTSSPSRHGIEAWEYGVAEAALKEDARACHPPAALKRAAARPGGPWLMRGRRRSGWVSGTSWTSLQRGELAGGGLSGDLRSRSETEAAGEAMSTWGTNPSTMREGGGGRRQSRATAAAATVGGVGRQAGAAGRPRVAGARELQSSIGPPYRGRISCTLFRQTRLQCLSCLPLRCVRLCALSSSAEKSVDSLEC
jgi:hypothetical protein